MQKAIVGAGCFWEVQHLFDNIKGVVSTKVGYIGGNTQNPTYKEVCRGDTNHIEAVEIIFDESLISYEEILDIFFKNHNPTTPNRQGVDVGTQYRSAILYTNESQKEVANSTMQKQQDTTYKGVKIVTQILQATTFYQAEEYHQKYIEKNRDGGCSV